jgi:hypothetical protein
MTSSQRREKRSKKYYKVGNKKTRNMKTVWTSWLSSTFRANTRRFMSSSFKIMLKPVSTSLSISRSQ